MKILLAFLLILACLAQEHKYNEKVSSQMIQLSAAIYNITLSDQQANLCPDCYPGFSLYRQILGNQILSIVGVDEELESIVVVFRGSSNTANWLTDAKIIKVGYNDDSRCNKCKVHRGFYNSHKRLVDGGLNNVIKEVIAAYPNYGIIFTGHSLGGAVANLAAVTIRQQFPQLSIQVYTFGQPRVGNENYARYFDRQVSSYFRVVHQRDAVPHKPAYIAFYRHSGTEFWYKDGMNGDYVQCKGESNYCSNGLGSLNSDYSFKDHSSRNYIKLLHKVNPNNPIVAPEDEPLDEEHAIHESKASLQDGHIDSDQSDLFERMQTLDL